MSDLNAHQTHSGGANEKGPHRRLSVFWLVLSLVLAYEIHQFFDHKEEVEARSIAAHTNNNIILPMSALLNSDRVEQVVSHPTPDTAKVMTVVHSLGRYSSGSLHGEFPPCIPEPPGFWKKLVYFLPIELLTDVVTPEHVSAETFIARHSGSEGLAGWLARRFPSQLVASCLHVEVLNSSAWKGYKVIRVRVFVRRADRADEWHECERRHTDRCGVSEVLWANVPSEESISKVAEWLRTDTSLMDQAIMGAEAATFVNWSPYKMDAKVEVELARASGSSRGN